MPVAAPARHRSVLKSFVVALSMTIAAAPLLAGSLLRAQVIAGPNFAPSSTELGTDVYPGVKLLFGSKLDTGEELQVTGQYETADAGAKVIAFYKSKLGKDSTYDGSDGSSGTITKKISDQETITVEVADKSGQSDGTTKINVTHHKMKN